MEIVSLLLVAGMAQLFSLTACSPIIQPNLKDIVNEIPKLNEIIHKENFVEDVQDLADNCTNAFFCKVLDILKNHQHFSKVDRQQEHNIVKNLLQFTKNMKCEEKPKKESGVKTAITELLENLKKCSEHRNSFSSWLETGSITRHEESWQPSDHQLSPSSAIQPPPPPAIKPSTSSAIQPPPPPAIKPSTSSAIQPPPPPAIKPSTSPSVIQQPTSKKKTKIDDEEQSSGGAHEGGCSWIFV